MKEVIPQKEKDIVTIDKVNPKFYYGVLFKYRFKGVIVRSKGKEEDYKILRLDLLTKGNTFSCCSIKYTLQDLINSIISPVIKVYQFKTSKKLFKWLAE